jgi:cytochrome c-type biogenesis protein CcmH
VKLRLLAALLAAGLVTGLVPAAPVGATESKPTAAELESELVCPVCETTLDTSDAPIARRMKAFIRARITAGDTKSEIKAKLVDQFGTTVLAVPPRKGFDLVAWLLPLAGLAAGAGVVGVVAWRWSRIRREGSEAADEPLDPALERRLDDELARFE